MAYDMIPSWSLNRWDKISQLNLLIKFIVIETNFIIITKSEVKEEMKV